MTKKTKKNYKLQRKQKIQLAVVTVITLVAAFLAILLLTPVFNVSEIEVIGCNPQQESDIRIISGIDTGVNILNIDTDAAEENIRSLSYIKKAEVSRDFPSTIRIKVEVEIGVAYFESKDGFVIITSKGKCIDVTRGSQTTSKNPEKMPVITGMGKISYKKGRVIKAEDELRWGALLDCLHEFERQGYISDMKEIDVSRIDDIRFFYKGRALCVSVGNAENVDYKMQCFKPIYEEVVQMTKAGQLPKGFIDLEHNTYRENIEVQTVENDEKEQEKENNQ